MTKKEKTAGQKLDAITTKVSEVGSDIGEKLEKGTKEGKKVARGIQKRWANASIEEVFTTILGIVLLVCALWHLKSIIRGVLLLLIGILCVSGYFNPIIEEIVDSVWEKIKNKKAKKGKKSE